MRGREPCLGERRDLGSGPVDGKGNVNSSELTNVPEGYKLKEVGDFYYDGGAELRIQIVPWYR